MPAPLLVLGYIAAGSAISGVTAWMCGAFDDEEDKTAFKNGQARGEAESKAKFKSDVDAANENMRNMKKENDSYKLFFNKGIALVALGASAATCNGGGIEKAQAREILELVGGLCSESYPEEVQKQMAAFIVNPPSLEQSISLVKSAGNVAKEECLEMIDCMITFHGNPTRNQVAFRKKWIEKA
ncbi:hypothetical protein VCR3J2_410273 [Vibrio coralliirubri]|uniref:hypothetical protein n=1 Tax=Vibrio coralliirubri TaxID=1516159 RepID=UPI00062F515A|nr:hypothetical protein [Vibrio coralliirubri]CDT66423.1 hypothetical protein VCR15J2_470393 [Vibrio coralliirubri]CDU10186.1 hypothetical protein VCR3J2_410273 [Vibrio coralliirubri]